VRIWFQKHTVQGRLPGLDQAYEAHLRRVARPDTEVYFSSLPEETYQGPLPEGYVRYGCVEAFFSNFFALQALRAQQEGYDAYIIGTSQDPGLQAARAVADIPVLGYGETAAHVASMLGTRFAFVGFIPELAEPIAANMRTYGLQEKLGAFAYVEGGPGLVEEALQGRPGPFVDAFLRAARRSVSSGADVVVPGEGIPNEILVAAGVTEVDGAPILDVNGLLVKMAELMVDLQQLGIARTSRLSYFLRRPPAEQLAHIIRLFGPKAMG
jgi:allantoin racemase